MVKYALFFLLIATSCQNEGNSEVKTTTHPTPEFQEVKPTLKGLLTNHAFDQIKLSLSRPELAKLVDDKIEFKSAEGMLNAYIIRLALDTADASGNYSRDYVFFLYKFHGGDSLQIGNYALLDLYR